MKVVLDTNCFIDYATTSAPAHAALQTIFALHDQGVISLLVSRHSLVELQVRPDTALDVANKLPVLPYYPIGNWSELVGSWADLAGTWADAADANRGDLQLASLAKAGADIRDRGACIDAVRASVDVFVTSDKQLAGSGPAKRIESAFSLAVMTPQAFALEFSRTTLTY